MGMVQDSRQLIEVRESAAKGLGIFATANIPRGTRVIAEPGILKINRENADAKDIVQAFESLPSSKQSSFLELHAFTYDAYKRAAEREMKQNWQDMPSLHRKVLAIHAANAFGDVFLLGSRINHSCIPNIHFAYNDVLEKETFHAIRDIIAGEELSICYINGINRTKDQRQAELDRYGFICTCPACEDTEQGKEREEKRAMLFDLDQKLAISLRTKSWKQALKSASKLATIQKSEGLLTRELSNSYRDAVRACVMLEKSKMALSWVEKELEIDRCCVGGDHAGYQEVLDIAKKLRVAVESSEPVDETVIEWFNSQDSSGESCITM